MSSVWAELRRRNVVKVAVAYAIVGWLLVEVASVVLPTFKAPEWIMQVFTFLVIVGFPIVLIFAWAFEITPEGIKLEKDVDRTQSITCQAGRKLDIIIIGAMAVVMRHNGFSIQPFSNAVKGIHYMSYTSFRDFADLVSHKPFS